MASVGDTVFYQESPDPDAPSWCVGQILMTDTVPSADSVTAITDAFGTYPVPPGSGGAYLVYWAMAGQDEPTQAFVSAVPGTGPQQWATAIPEGW
jgi:hypothetical protein